MKTSRVVAGTIAGAVLVSAGGAWFAWHAQPLAANVRKSAPPTRPVGHLANPMSVAVHLLRPAPSHRPKA